MKKLSGYWKKWGNIVNAFEAVINELGHFPSQSELQKLNRYDILAAVSRHWGGLINVRIKMGYNLITKPAGYWQDWNNVVNELEPFIEKLNHFPTESELEELGRYDIINGVKKHWGGLFSIKEKMGYELTTKPSGYWQNWDNIVNELEPIIRDLGHFPSRTELEELRRYDIINGVKKHWSGLLSIRKKMGYELTTKPPSYWQNWDNIVTELEPIIEGLGHFPTQTELTDMNRQDILHGVSRHWGGLITVREKMGYKLADLSEKRSYHAKKGYKTQEEIVKIIKEYADLSGISYQKDAKVGPHQYLELFCDERIGVDVANTRSERYVEDKWKKYAGLVDIFWEIIISDKWGDEQYEEWNLKSPENVIIIDGRKLEDFLNSIGTSEVPFKIPLHKKEKLDALARCTFRNREEIKKELEELKNQRKLDIYGD